MQEIYSTDFLKITEDKSKSIFTIDLSFGNRILIDSLTKTRIIQGATATDDYKSIKFKAHSVIPLIKFKEQHNNKSGSSSLPINMAADMTNCLTIQLNYLTNVYAHTILGYSPENIIVINSKKFAFLGGEYVTEIEDNMLQISYPFTSNDFFVSPEMLNLNKLPSYVHYKTSYFSLACLIIYALMPNGEFYKEYLKHHQIDKIIEHLNSHSIKGTKLYWLLSRCLVEEAKNRSILLI
jgi:hypothetical protein